MLGARPSAVATLVERLTRTVRLDRLPGVRAPDVRAALIQNLGTLLTGPLRTLAWGRGRKNSEHERIAQTMGIGVFFCDPRSLWLRGWNENTNRRLRQYLPNQADLFRFIQTELDRIADQVTSHRGGCSAWTAVTTGFLTHS